MSNKHDTLSTSIGQTGLHPNDAAAREAVSEMIKRWDNVNFLEAEVFLIEQGVINDTYIEQGDPDE